MKLIIYPLLALCCLLTGCMSDDLSGCAPAGNVILRFEYPDFEQRIEQVWLDIFDAAGYWMTSAEVTRAALDQFQGVNLSLPYGEYTAVCWGNALAKTAVEGVYRGNPADDMIVSHPAYFKGETIDTNDPLYYSSHHFEVSGTTGENTLHFTPAHIRMQIYVAGLSSRPAETAGADYPYIRIDGLHPAYDAQMRLTGGPVSYYPSITVDTTEDEAVATVDVLRFEAAETPVMIQVVANSPAHDILYTLDLRDFLSQNKITIRPGEEARLSIRIEFNGSEGVEVSLTGWGTAPTEPGI